MVNGNKTVSVIRTYWYLVYPDGSRVPITRTGYAQFLTLSRTNPEVAESGFSAVAETHTFEFPACVHCRVRPVATDVGSFGTYLLSVCDHPLCVRGRRIAYEGLSRESAETIREFFR